MFPFSLVLTILSAVTITLASRCTPLTCIISYRSCIIGVGQVCMKYGTNYKTDACKYKCDCAWSEWSNPPYEKCPVTCGGGIMTRIRTRTKAKPASNGGKDCTGESEQKLVSACNTFSCPVDCKWSEWSNGGWGSCSAVCGGGKMTRTLTRTVEIEAVKGGLECTGNTTKIEERSCNSQQCPVDCKWSAWSNPPYERCPVTCGGGIMTRIQTRTKEKIASNGGKDCTGDSEQKGLLACNTFSCPVDCKWSEWSKGDWGYCSAICGGGTMTRTLTRTVEIEAAKGGLECTGNTSKIEEMSCNSQQCPVDGGWSEWSNFTEWENCNKTCMKTRLQRRQCNNPAPVYGGRRCVGANKNMETIDCYEGDCLDSACRIQSYNRAALPRNCGQFVVCLDSGNVVQSCPPETHWSQTYVTCVHATSSSCQDSDDANDDGEYEGEKCIWPKYTIAGRGCVRCQSNYAETSGCVTSYILCAAGMGYRIPCPPGTSFNQTAGVCDHGNCSLSNIFFSKR